MNKTMTRKTILLSLIAVFLCIYILQLALSGHNEIKVMTLEATPDTLVMVKGSGAANASNTVRMVYENNAWTVGEKKYAADNTTATKMADGIKNLKLLGVITHSAGSNPDKYGLGDNDKITVTAYKDGKSVRTITAGKNASSGGQCYVQVDGKDTVYLADGTLHDTYGVSLDTVRSKEIYSASSADITAVHVELAGSSYSVQKTAPKADLAAPAADAKATADKPAQSKWEVVLNGSNAPAPKVDDEKTDSWINSLTSLKASTWTADTDTLPSSAPEAKVTIVSAGKEYSVSIYKLADAEDPRYICSSNTTPYLFYISKYVAERYVKHIDDLIAK